MDHISFFDDFEWYWLKGQNQTFLPPQVVSTVNLNHSVLLRETSVLKVFFTQKQCNHDKLLTCAVKTRRYSIQKCVLWREQSLHNRHLPALISNSPSKWRGVIGDNGRDSFKHSGETELYRHGGSCSLSSASKLDGMRVPVILGGTPAGACQVNSAQPTVQIESAVACHIVQ